MDVWGERPLSFNHDTIILFSIRIKSQRWLYDEQTLNNTRLNYAQVYIELDASLPMAYNFLMKCRLSSDSIIIMCKYEWKPRTYDICRVFGHFCKALVKALNLSVEDMLKIQNRGNALHTYSSPGIIVNEVHPIQI